MKNKKILVVGSGGIGCELLKLLSAMGCMSITIVDFDIIQLSNLSRQLYFTQDDLNSYKSQVVGRKYLQSNPNANIKTKFDSIQNYDILFFSTFDVVFNCLDNNDARSYVSKRCLFSKTILIDGGSKGILGQSMLFDFRSECFDCTPKKLPVEIPICTIRSFPTDFTHCVSWAEMYFSKELQNISGMGFESIIKKYFVIGESLYNENVLTADEVSEFILLIHKLINTENSCDKDNDDFIKLIYLSALIKAAIHGIERKGFFETQEIISNIVPSICTTNAIVASLMVIGMNTGKSYFITKSSRLLISLDAADKNSSCDSCGHKKYVLRWNNNETMSSLIKLMSKELGSCREIYTDVALVYDKYYRKNINSVFTVPSNEFFYYKNNDEEIAMVYSLVTDSVSFEEISYNL